MPSPAQPALKSRADSAERQRNAVNTQQNQIEADDIPNRKSLEPRIDEHQRAENQTDDVQNQRENIHELAGKRPNRVQIGQAGNAVRAKLLSPLCFRPMA